MRFILYIEINKICVKIHEIEKHNFKHTACTDILIILIRFSMNEILLQITLSHTYIAYNLKHINQM